jgi:hypothetical protein
MTKQQWLSVREYCKKMNIKNPQVIYNRIAMGKLNGKWREVKIVKVKKEVLYEEN